MLHIYLTVMITADILCSDILGPLLRQVKQSPDNSAAKS